MPRCLKFCESLTETMFSFTNIVMYYAPVGVGATMAYTVAHVGIGVLAATAWEALAYRLSPALNAFSAIRTVTHRFGRPKLPLGRFVQAVAEPATIAFATSTSRNQPAAARDGIHGSDSACRDGSMAFNRVPAGYWLQC